MRWIPGGEFLMGSEAFYVEERPVRLVHVDGFWACQAGGRTDTLDPLSAGKGSRSRPPGQRKLPTCREFLK
jgi:hypothetical protein